MIFPPDLFKPGNGAHPPYLAGRDAELQALEPLEAALAARHPAYADVVLHGPRGNGKTVLLNVLGDRLRNAGTNVVRTTPKGSAASRKALAKALAPEGGWRGAMRRLSENAGGVVPNRVSVFGVRLDLNQSAGVTLEQTLACRCADGPLALLVDEAHTLSPKLGGELLDASQNIRNSGAPFLLVLAGTPGIQYALQATGASHWERSKKVRVGRLDAGEDRAALMRPIADLDGCADPDALTLLVEAANRYPYFLQEVGSAIVAALNARDTTRIEERVAEDALHSFSAVRSAFYDTRVDELDDAGLLTCAAAVARVFGDQDWVGRTVVASALADSLGEKAARRARRGLVTRGVIWPKSGRRLRAGHPFAANLSGAAVVAATAVTQTSQRSPPASPPSRRRSARRRSSSSALDRTPPSRRSAAA